MVLLCTVTRAEIDDIVIHRDKTTRLSTLDDTTELRGRLCRKRRDHYNINSHRCVSHIGSWLEKFVCPTLCRESRIGGLWVVGGGCGGTYRTSTQGDLSKNSSSVYQYIRMYSTFVWTKYTKRSTKRVPGTQNTGTVCKSAKGDKVIVLVVY